MSIWVLLEEYNDYDQHGSYFVHAWDHKPTKENLVEQGVGPHHSHKQDYLEFILNGGGRITEARYYDEQWYLLQEVK